MKKIISVVLMISTLLINSTVLAKEYPQKFWDVSKNHWAFEYIADLADRGVISGCDDGSFRPENTVSRAEWAKMMVVAAGLVINDNSTNFTDMQNHWANKYVNTAKNYLTGYKDGSYRPNQATTREDVTVALVKLKGYDLSAVDYSNLSRFSDNDSISNYAKAYVSVALAKDLISGFDDNTFRGQATLTRAEAATLLYRAFQKGSDDKITDISEMPALSESYLNEGEKQNEASNITVQTPQQTQTIKQDLIPAEKNKPYVIEKLTSANIKTVSYASTYDYDDSIYFIDQNDNNVYKISISNGEKKLYLDTSDLCHQKIEEQEIENVKTVAKTVETGEFETVEEEIEETIIDEETGEETTVVTTFKKQVPITEEITEDVVEIETKEIVTAEYNSYIPTQVFYDNKNDRLLLWGYYRTLSKAFSSSQSVVQHALYDITGDVSTLYCSENISFETDEFICEFLDKDRMITNYADGYVSKIINFENENILMDYYSFYSTDILIYGSNMYSCYSGSISNSYIRKYNFNDNKWEVLSDKISASSYGIKNEYYYFWTRDNGKIYKISVKDGTMTELAISTNADNTEFADMGNMDKINTKFYVIDDNTLIFYDRSMQAFRMLTRVCERISVNSRKERSSMIK